MADDPRLRAVAEARGREIIGLGFDGLDEPAREKVIQQSMPRAREFLAMLDAAQGRQRQG